jgi:energy-coupling factor transporter ATP-binding protein EcfA2
MAVVTAVTVSAVHQATGRRPARAYGGRRLPVPGRPRKGGTLPGRVDEYLLPLRPLSVPAHEKRYLAVDRSQERFSEFTVAFADPADWAVKGHMVVVTGDRGFGKTSLIQRCAAWLRNHSQSHCRVVVADLSDERLSAEDTEDERIRQTLDLVLDELRNTLQADEISKIRGRPSVNESFRDLERVLSSRSDLNNVPEPPIELVILLPGYPRPAEVARYYTFARRGLFFFAELFDKDDIEVFFQTRSAFNRVGVDIHHLALGMLKLGDATLLVDWIKSEGGNWPDVPMAIKDYFDRIVDKYSIGISELARLAWGALCVAADESASGVTHEHISRYYEMEKFASSA